MQQTKQYLKELFGQLEAERQSYEPQWKDVVTYIAPKRGQFLHMTDTGNGIKNDQKIINNVARMASQTFSAGMMSHVTNPSRKWFNLSTSDKNKNELYDVSSWLHDVKTQMYQIFAQSNLYRELRTLYGDLADFATSAIFIEKDEKTIIHTQCLNPGSYYLMTNHKGEVVGFARKISMTVQQIYNKFIVDSQGNEDWENVSDTIKAAWKNNTKLERYSICHFILENENYDPKSSLSKYKKYKSVYYEDNNTDKFIGEYGYNNFPVFGVRWKSSGAEAYGTDSPGLICLSDNKQLQYYEKQLTQTIDKKIDPPLIADSSLKSKPTSTLPGSISYADSFSGKASVANLQNIDFNSSEIKEVIFNLENRIKEAYHVNLFLMLTNEDRRQITATEIMERKQEKLLALGPVLEQINQDLLDPLIDITFEYMNEFGLIPEVPEELDGIPLKIEYISVMNQAQKQSELNTINPLIQLVSNLAQINPDAVKKINVFEIIDEYGDKLNISPGIIRPEEEIQEMMEQEQEARQAELQREESVKNAMVNKELSQTKLDENSALMQLMENANA